jgi:regulator of sigma E protease
MILLTAFFGLLGLGIIVFIHELGHFVSAKACGIEVETFSLGWGKKMVGFVRGGTSYQISWFPIGGYCKMKGEMPKGQMDEAEMDRMRSDRGSFLAASPWQRTLVAVAGPLANIVFAVVVLTLIWWIGFNIHSAGNRIVLASDYDLDPFSEELPAASAGLKTGDRITRINDTEVGNFWEISEIIKQNAKRMLLLKINRERSGFKASHSQEIRIVPQRDPTTGFGKIGIYAWIDPIVDSVEAGKPGSIAGLQTADFITRVNDSPIRHDIDFYQSLKDKPDSVILTFRRGKEERTGVLNIEYNRRGEMDLGFTFKHNVYRSPRLGPFQSLHRGFQKTFEILGLTARGLWQLVRFKVNKLDEVVAGPIRITKMVGEAATGGFTFGVGEGVVSFLQFICLLSVMIAIMNLLPIPVLDGGLIILSIIEGLRNRPLKLKVIYRFQIVGFLIVFLLIVTALLSDILFFVG